MGRRGMMALAYSGWCGVLGGRRDRNRAAAAPAIIHGTSTEYRGKLVPSRPESDGCSLSRSKAIKQEIETFPESAVPIVIQQQTGAFNCRVVFAETCQALLRGDPVVV